MSGLIPDFPPFCLRKARLPNALCVGVNAPDRYVAIRRKNSQIDNRKAIRPVAYFCANGRLGSLQGVLTRKVNQHRRYGCGYGGYQDARELKRHLVGPSRNSLVGSTSKHTCQGPASRIRIVPTSMHRPVPGVIHCVFDLALGQIQLKLQAAKHGAQQVIADLDAIRDGLADRLGLSQKSLGLCFHGLTVGQINQRRNAEIQGVSR